MLRINIVDGASYQNGFINISLHLCSRPQAYLTDLCLPLSKLSFPAKSVHEIRLAAELLERMEAAVKNAFLRACKSWLAIEGASFLRICVQAEWKVASLLEALQDNGYEAEATIGEAMNITVIAKSMTALHDRRDETDCAAPTDAKTYETLRAKQPWKSVSQLETTMPPAQAERRTGTVGVYLWGGLGNQLYLYAFAKSMAMRRNTEVLVERSFFQTQIDGITPHGFKLHHFSLAINEIGNKEMSAILLTDIERGPWNDGYDYRQRGWLQEQYERRFDPNVLSIDGDLFITGYWQSYKYFQSIREVLLRELEIKTPPSDQTRAMCEQIDSTNAVSLHIRRGDYLIQGQGMVLPGAYYQQAVQRMLQHVEKPHFYIFSDDPEWVRRNISMPFPMTIVDFNTAQTDYDDLRMMSRCRHHILANSTFSWWGAWLNKRREKQVVCPSYGRDIDQDLYPEGWMAI